MWFFSSFSSSLVPQREGNAEEEKEVSETNVMEERRERPAPGWALLSRRPTSFASVVSAGGFGVVPSSFPSSSSSSFRPFEANKKEGEGTAAAAAAAVREVKEEDGPAHVGVGDTKEEEGEEKKLGEEAEAEAARSFLSIGLDADTKEEDHGRWEEAASSVVIDDDGSRLPSRMRRCERCSCFCFSSSCSRRRVE